MGNEHFANYKKNSQQLGESFYLILIIPPP